MPRPVTLFTGQWADLPFEQVCRLASDWGYDGLEIACWGDHLDVARAVADDAYLYGRRALLDRYGLQVHAISNHLNGQAVCDDPIDDGYADFAARWNPVLDVFDEVGVRFAHEVHPSEIAYDYWTTTRALDAIGHRPAFGLNWDPSHFVWQDLDPVGFLWDFRDRIYHVDCKDAKRQTGNGRNGRLGSHLPWSDPRRGWDFVSTGHGDVPWESCFRMLNTIGYDGPVSVEWEDAGMDRLIGAPEALAFVRSLAFDAAFSTSTERAAD
ncbi:sugar phosphate isomerase/epimerase family protein [Streptomyces sp. NPDC090994]|uniref:sugar phosphate isomerase/epimerase family protein n=1 Tax=Streptomyces sp. NPDC090994 TaxID=3365969 RepID=UPI0037F4F382